MADAPKGEKLRDQLEIPLSSDTMSEIVRTCLVVNLVLFLTVTSISKKTTCLNVSIGN